MNLVLAPARRTSWRPSPAAWRCATAVVTDVTSQPVRPRSSVPPSTSTAVSTSCGQCRDLHRGEFAGGDLSGFLRLIDTNVGGVVRTVYAALEHMVRPGPATSSSPARSRATRRSTGSPSTARPSTPCTADPRPAASSWGPASGWRGGAGMVLNDLWNVSGDEEVAAGVAAGAGLRSETWPTRSSTC